jgi:hypothetical protein
MNFTMNDDKIAREALVDRAIYRIRSHNLVVGIWSEAKNAFIGVRNKFNEDYLDIEPVSDVTVLEKLDFELPLDVKLTTTLGTICVEDGRTVVFTEPIMYGGSGWVYTSDGKMCEGKLQRLPNLELFDILKPLSDRVHSNYRHRVFEDLDSYAII